MNGARPAVCVNVCGSRMKKCVDDQGKDRRTTSLGYLRMWIQGLGRQRQQHPVGPKRQKCSPVLKRKKATEVETAVRLCRSLPERRRVGLWWGQWGKVFRESASWPSPQTPPGWGEQPVLEARAFPV